MTRRSPAAVLILTLITFGIYGIFWFVKTKEEMNAMGAQIPTAWLLIVPLVNIWWYWKYSEGVEQSTRGAMSAAVAFILLFLLGPIGMAILQAQYNKLAPATA